MPKMNNKPRLIALDPQSCSLLERLGKVTGSSAVEKRDLDSPAGRAILSSLPILKNDDYGLQKCTPGDLELLRRFVHGGRPNTTVWAKIQLNANGTIQRIKSPANVELAHELLKNPKHMLDEVSRHRDDFVQKLPTEWSPEQVSAIKILAHFARLNRQILSVSNDLDTEQWDPIFEEMGPELTWLLFNATAVIHMKYLSQRGTDSEKTVALKFLEDFRKFATPYLQIMSHDSRTGEKLKLPAPFANALQIMSLLIQNP